MAIGRLHSLVSSWSTISGKPINNRRISTPALGFLFQVEGELAATGGGYSSGGDFTVEGGGKASFSNSSFAMDQPEVILVTLQAGREVTKS